MPGLRKNPEQKALALRYCQNSRPISISARPFRLPAGESVPGCGKTDGRVRFGGHSMLFLSIALYFSLNLLYYMCRNLGKWDEAWEKPRPFGPF